MGAILDALFGTGSPGDRAVAQHGVGQVMHEASKHNMAGRVTATHHNNGHHYNWFTGGGANTKPASDAQILVNDASNQAGYDSALY